MKLHTSHLATSFFSQNIYDDFTVFYHRLFSAHVSVNRGGAPIGAGGVMTPPLFEAKGTGEHNLGIIHISHIALITPSH